jgi:hypothetical protein
MHPRHQPPPSLPPSPPLYLLPLIYTRREPEEVERTTETYEGDPRTMMQRGLFGGSGSGGLFGGGGWGGGGGGGGPFPHLPWGFQHRGSSDGDGDGSSSSEEGAPPMLPPPVQELLKEIAPIFEDMQREFQQGAEAERGDMQEFAE